MFVYINIYRVSPPKSGFLYIMLNKLGCIPMSRFWGRGLNKSEGGVWGYSLSG